MKLFLYIFTFFVLVSFLPVPYLSANSSIKSLRDIDNTLSVLEQQKKELYQNWDNFRLWNWKLTDFIRKDLTENNKRELEEIILFYLQEKEKNASNPSSHNSQKLRDTFFTQLEPFISSQKKTLFYDYKNKGAEFEENVQSITQEISSFQDEKEKRVDSLRSKIEENSSLLRNQIKSSISEKVYTRLNIFIEQKNFKNLDASIKKEIFTKLLIKMTDTRRELENQAQLTTVIRDRATAYRVIEDILEEYINQW